MQAFAKQAALINLRALPTPRHILERASQIGVKHCTELVLEIIRPAAEGESFDQCLLYAAKTYHATLKYALSLPATHTPSFYKIVNPSVSWEH